MPPIIQYFGDAEPVPAPIPRPTPTPKAAKAKPKNNVKQQTSLDVQSELQVDVKPVVPHVDSFKTPRNTCLLVETGNGTTTTYV